MSNSNNRVLVPEAKQGLSKFKNEVAQELGVPFTEYNGDLSSRQCGSVGGEMVKRMVELFLIYRKSPDMLRLLCTIKIHLWV